MLKEQNLLVTLNEFSRIVASKVVKVGGELIYPKLPKTKKTQCYQTFFRCSFMYKSWGKF